MPTYRSKALDSLIKTETELKGLVANLKTTKSPSAAKKNILDAKNIVGKALLAMPSSEQYLSSIKKSLTAILNVLGGLNDGLQDGSLERKDFVKTVDNLNNRFIPKFRESVDFVLKKASTQGARLNKDGLLQDDENILEDLKKVSTDVKRLVRSLSAAKNHALDSSQVDLMVKSRSELAISTYESLPQGKDLDAAAESLLQISETCLAIAKRALAKNEVPDKLVRELGGSLFDLDRDIAAINKKVMNNILEYKDTKRPTTVTKKLRDQEAELPLTRSPDEFLKEKIADIKSGKKETLPKRIKGAYAFLTSPVVAIFNSQDDIAKRDRPSGPGTVSHNFSKSKVLDQFGIKYIMLEDYLILQDQKVLAIDKPTLEAYATEQIKKARGKSRAAIRLKDTDYVEYARQLLEMVNERSSQHYVMVSHEFTANPRNTSMILFWVMPSRILDALIQRGWNKLSSWSLPFDN